MFKIKCSDADLREKLQSPYKHYPPAVCAELNWIMEHLQRDGQLTRTDFYDLNTHRIDGKTLYLFYRPKNTSRVQEVLIVDVKVKTADVFKQEFSIVDSWDDRDLFPSIPQYDQPKKLIRAVKLVHQGITDPYLLGDHLGHQGKKKDYVKRHGYYALHALEQLKLIETIDNGKRRPRSIYVTELGRSIAMANNEEEQDRHLISAMLNYQPIWKIITAVSTNAGNLEPVEVLTDELVNTLTFADVDREVGTSQRRSKTLRRWINWISARSGIPIWVNKDALQLTIPFLYADQSALNS